MSTSIRQESFGQRRETLFDSIIKTLRFKKISKKIPFGIRLVDLGCGYHGDLLKSFASTIKNGVGIDLTVSPDVIAPNVALQTGKIDGKLDIPSASVDVVTALAVIEHVNRPKIFLQEIYRILKPRGSLLMTTPSTKARRLLEFLAFNIKLIDAKEIADHKRYYNLETIRNSLIDAGFKQNKISLKPFQLGLNIFVEAKK